MTRPSPRLHLVLGTCMQRRHGARCLLLHRPLPKVPAAPQRPASVPPPAVTSASAVLALAMLPAPTRTPTPVLLSHQLLAPACGRAASAAAAPGPPPVPRAQQRPIKPLRVVHPRLKAVRVVIRQAAVPAAQQRQRQRGGGSNNNSHGGSGRRRRRQVGGAPGSSGTLRHSVCGAHFFSDAVLAAVAHVAPAGSPHAHAATVPATPTSASTYTTQPLPPSNAPPLSAQPSHLERCSRSQARYRSSRGSAHASRCRSRTGPRPPCIPPDAPEPPPPSASRGPLALAGRLLATYASQTAHASSGGWVSCDGGGGRRHGVPATSESDTAPWRWWQMCGMKPSARWHMSMPCGRMNGTTCGTAACRRLSAQGPFKPNCKDEQHVSQVVLAGIVPSVCHQGNPYPRHTARCPDPYPPQPPKHRLLPMSRKPSPFRPYAQQDCRCTSRLQPTALRTYTPTTLHPPPILHPPPMPHCDPSTPTCTPPEVTTLPPHTPPQTPRPPSSAR